MFEKLTYSREGAVATITMDDGKVNCLSPQMLSELDQAFERAREDRVVVVLTGRPQRFSAGFDLSVFARGGIEAREMLIGGFELAEKILSFPLPVLAGCNGHALAMGSFLLLSADVRIGAAGAFKIGANEVAIGMTVPHAALEICKLRLAPTHFTRAIMTAEIYTPDAAVGAGFLDRVVPESELLPTVQALAAELTKLDLAAHAATKLRAREEFLPKLRAAIERDETNARAA